MAIETGKNWKFYLNTNTAASPTWTLISEQVDGTFEITQNTTDGTTKDHSGFTSSIATTRTWAGSFSVMYDASDTTTAALMAASLAGTQKHFKLVGESGENWIGYAWISVKVAASVDAAVKADLTLVTDGAVTYAAS